MNNNELKAEKMAFFGTYINQDVLSFDVNRKRRVYTLTPTRIESYSWHDDSWLELTDLKNITDEHAIEVGKIVGCWNTKEITECGDEIHGELKIYGKLLCNFFDKEIGVGASDMLGCGFTDLITAIDKLRELGYLVSFRSLSPAQIIELGWAKIKEK